MKQTNIDLTIKSLELLPDQMRQILKEARLIKIPKNYHNFKQIVVSGMGGSNLAARIIRAVATKSLTVPLTILAGYEIPAYVGQDTLYILSSYSGNTEEPLSTYKKAKKQGAKIMAITADTKKNKLKEIMLQDNLPGIIYRPDFNPSAQPRLGLGYSLFGLITLLSKVELYKFNLTEANNIISTLELWNRELRPIENKKINVAKKIAKKIHGRLPILISAEFLAGNTHTLRNQINESAKQFATYLVLPDLNHYAMEGLSFPENNKQNLIFLFFDSNLYSPRVQRRLLLTKQIIRKNKIQYIDYKLKGKTRLSQACEFLQFGSWLSYYLGALNKVDPIKIPWVDWFKKELK